MAIVRTNPAAELRQQLPDRSFSEPQIAMPRFPNLQLGEKLGIQFDEPISGWAKITVGANGSCVLKINNQNIPIQLAEEEQV